MSHHHILVSPSYALEAGFLSDVEGIE